MTSAQRGFQTGLLAPAHAEHVTLAGHGNDNTRLQWLQNAPLSAAAASSNTRRGDSRTSTAIPVRRPARGAARRWPPAAAPWPWRLRPELLLEECPESVLSPLLQAIPVSAAFSFRSAASTSKSQEPLCPGRRLHSVAHE